MKIYLEFLKSYLVNPCYLIKNIKWRFPRTISKNSYVFVLGCPRSGTSLMLLVLSSHSKLFSIGSEVNLFSYINIFSRKHFGLKDNENSNLFNSSIDIIDFFDNAVKILSKREKFNTFIDKSPPNILRLSFLLKHFPNSKFVNLIRDGRDCYCSSRKNRLIPHLQDVKVFARYWKKCINKRFEVNDSSRIYDIKYEEFAKNPMEELKKIMDFLGFDFEKRQLDPNVYGEGKQSSHKGFEKLTTTVNEQSVKRWRDELTEDENKKFLSIAGPELKLLGYET